MSKKFKGTQRLAPVLMGVLLFGLTSTILAAHPAASGGFDPCSVTAQFAYQACRNAAQNDFWIALGICINSSSSDDDEACLQDARENLTESLAECGDQRESRMEVCAALGGGAYDPVIRPDHFVDPERIGVDVEPNPFFPLIAGRRWVYRNDEQSETNTVTVTSETKEILGVVCRVVHDVVEVDGEGVTEDTLDWYAQDKDGNVWYFGELSKTMEDGEILSLEGSWTAGEDGAKPGIVMPAEPVSGTTYRQEFALGEAEDMGTIVGVGEVTVTVPYGSFSQGILETEDFSPLEPGVVEHKYYAPGIGLILERDPESGERNELTETNF